MTPPTKLTLGAKLRAHVAATWVWVLIFLATSHCEPAVRLKVTPNQSFAPSVIRFTVTIAPNALNRKACLSYDGPEQSLSCWQVDGTDHPITQWFERRVGGEGEYFAVLTVVRVENGKVSNVVATAQFTILEPGAPFVR